MLYPLELLDRGERRWRAFEPRSGVLSVDGRFRPPSQVLEPAGPKLEVFVLRLARDDVPPFECRLLTHRARRAAHVGVVHPETQRCVPGVSSLPA